MCPVVYKFYPPFLSLSLSWKQQASSKSVQWLPRKHFFFRSCVFRKMLPSCCCCWLEHGRGWSSTPGERKRNEEKMAARASVFVVDVRLRCIRSPSHDVSADGSGVRHWASRIQKMRAVSEDAGYVHTHIHVGSVAKSVEKWSLIARFALHPPRWLDQWLMSRSVADEGQGRPGLLDACCFWRC